MSDETRARDHHGVAAARNRVVAMSALVGIPSILVLALGVTGTDRFRAGGWWVWPLVLLGFVAAEWLVFHVEARNETVSFAPSEIPLAFGVLLLSPMGIITARFLAATFTMFGWRRQPAFKASLNVSSNLAETAVSVAVFRALSTPGDSASPAMFVWLTFSLFVGLVTGSMVVARAIAFIDGDFLVRARNELRHSYLFLLPGALLGGVVALPVLVEPWLSLMFLLPLAAMWLVLRSHGRLLRRFNNLRNIFDFSSLVGRSTGVGEIADTAVLEIADQMRARAVALVAWDRGDGAVHSTSGEPEVLGLLPDRPSDQDWDLPPENDVRLIDPRKDTDELAAALRDRSLGTSLVVTLHGDGQLIGMIVVAGRDGVVNRFTEEDRERLRQVAEQLGVVLRKAQLHVQIQHAATHDRLTGLPNRAYFEEWVHQTLPRTDRGLAVLLIDLDRFKEVNDTLGHRAGDTLLEQVGARIRGCLDDDDLAARFGGDEFAAVFAVADQREAQRRADVISDALEQPFDLGESMVAIAASIGIAMAPGHGMTAAELLRSADLAMYDAKRRHSRASIYESSLDGNDSVRLAMLGDLRDALHAGQLEVAFQPQVDLRTSRVAAVEALARWTHPVHGHVSPEVFVPVAEQAGLIEELTSFVLAESLGAARSWLPTHPDVGVAVNLSPLSLVNEDLPRVVATELARVGVPPRLLTLEITEQTVIGDTPRTVRILEQLAAIGVRLSVDDFGTGHSSLVNLRRLPISELKIDRSFVGGMLQERNDDVIVRSTIDLGHNLGFSVVAEGVETTETKHRLHALGCDLGQGFGISRPLPLDELIVWLAAAAAAPANPSP